MTNREVYETAVCIRLELNCVLGALYYNSTQKIEKQLWELWNKLAKFEDDLNDSGFGDLKEVGNGSI